MTKQKQLKPNKSSEKTKMYHDPIAHVASWLNQDSKHKEIKFCFDEKTGTILPYESNKPEIAIRCLLKFRDRVAMENYRGIVNVELMGVKIQTYVTNTITGERIEV